uniref:Uncharacterized protein n=1 Tax=Arundo donax TaxID=35708 RepID=A0A0A9CD86_ARUDO
MFWISEIF